MPSDGPPPADWRHRADRIDSIEVAAETEFWRLLCLGVPAPTARVLAAKPAARAAGARTESARRRVPWAA